MVTILDGSCGFGEWDNLLHVRRLKKLNLKDQKNYIKHLWAEFPEEYSEWKAWCVRLNRLPNLFGTRDNPISIDESNL